MEIGEVEAVECCAVEEDRRGEGRSVEVGMCEMRFHVTDARKMLASVAKLSDIGNLVMFGPRKEDHFIQNIKTGNRVEMRREKGLYVLDVGFVEDDRKECDGQIVVDSGAGGNVMPRNALRGGKMRARKEGIRFVAANGEEMGNFGTKNVRFRPKSGVSTEGDFRGRT